MTYLEKGIQIIDKINNNGYEAYLVGGAVRDYLLKIPIHDIDITTNMPLERITDLFSNTLSNNSQSYQSVTVIVDKDKYEITHFRKDLSYQDHRHPTVELVNTLQEDVVRRDFTINALAMDKDYHIYDYFSGVKDLENHLIKAIGNPEQRFFEDALRILRACSFAGRFDFAIEEKTLAGMKHNSQYLAELSNDRVYQYFISILYAKTGRGIDYLKKYDLLQAKGEFAKWLNIWKSNMLKEYLGVYYYLAYDELPPILFPKEMKLITVISYLEENDNDVYYLYKQYPLIPQVIKVFESMGLNQELAKKYADLSIKSEKDLAIPMSEIVEKINDNKKSYRIKELITNILNDKIKNNRKEITKYLESLSE